MLNKLIDTALIEHDFLLESQTDNSSFYIRKCNKSIRFAIVHNMYELKKPELLNAEITKTAPLTFKNNPAFSKNCDLICLLYNDSLDFSEKSSDLLSIEEDPYYYKKYVLYYDRAEKNILNNIEFIDILNIIKDMEQFEFYKSDPDATSLYSLATKIFIKLPFLRLPYQEKELVPLETQAYEAVEREGLLSFFEKIQKSIITSQDDDILIMELINEELENIKNSDT